MLADGRVLERAFELARAGECRTISDISRQLKGEGYEAVEAQLSGPSIRAQLRQLCMAVRRGVVAS